MTLMKVVRHGSKHSSFTGVTGVDIVRCLFSRHLTIKPDLSLPSRIDFADMSVISDGKNCHGRSHEDTLERLE